jgi:thiamine-monophosphate kinase
VLGEFDLIRRYLAPLATAPGALGLLDDAALFAPPEGSALVVTADALVAGVHFLPEDPADLVARKLLRVNLSDLAAMGARPLAYLMTANWPVATEEPWIARFAEGLARDQETFDISLLGGDTTTTPGPLTLSLTAIGAVSPDKALKRSTARAGDLIFVSGDFGDAALGLEAARGGMANLSEQDRAALIDRYRLPRPRLALGRALSERALATAAIDVSDGLVADLGHLCAASALAGEIEAARVPLSAAARAALGGGSPTRALTGGDDYELAFAVPPARAAEVAELAGRLDLPLTRIGRLAEGKGLRVLDPAGREMRFRSAGWTHF